MTRFFFTNSIRPLKNGHPLTMGKRVLVSNIQSLGRPPFPDFDHFVRFEFNNIQLEIGSLRFGEPLEYKKMDTQQCNDNKLNKVRTKLRTLT